MCVFDSKVQQEVLQKRQEQKKKMLQAVNRIKKGEHHLCLCYFRNLMKDLDIQGLIVH